MRTKNLFKVLATVVAMLCLSAILNAQAYLTNVGGYSPMTHAPAVVTDGSFIDSVGTPVNNVTEYATVGSKMPYAVRQDPNIGLLIASNIYNPSVFFVAIGLNATSPVTTAAADAAWNQAAYTITDTLTGGNALSKITIGGTPALNSLADVNYDKAPFTLDSVYAVNWLSTGTRHIWMYEAPISRTPGITACAGDSSSLTVVVSPKPRVDWHNDLAVGGAAAWVTQNCGNSNNVLYVDYSGFNDIKVRYDSTYTDLSGTTTLAGNKVVSYAGGAFGAANTSPGAGSVLTTWMYNQNAAGGSIAPRYGYVTYTITYVNDLISRKSLGRNVAVYGSVATGAGVDVDLATGGDLLANANIPSHTYRVYALPTPTARPIKHITNTGW